MIIDESAYLEHYGVLRRSGRYPWGSGSTQNVRNKDFLEYVDSMRDQGLTESEIARGTGITTTQLRAARTIARNQQKQAQITQAVRLKDKGMSNVAIGEKMGVGESQVRALLATSTKERADVLQTTAQMLRDQVAEKGFIDVGTGVESHIGISQTKLSAAVALLREEGYDTHRVKVPQLGTDLDTDMKILAAPGVTQRDVWLNRDKVRLPTATSYDDGRSFQEPLPPLKIDPKRVGVRYGDEGGAALDGVIYVRPGVPDVSLGNARYAQVRISVGDGHYLKGMAIYKDDLPKGVDLEFNTNKLNSGNKLDAMKPVSDDALNPYGSVTKPPPRIKLPDGTEKPSTAMNIVYEEGDWNRWSRTLPSQMLSKQSPTLAKTQLDMTFEKRQKELNEIMALTNPVVKKKLLEGFAKGTDSAAVHMKAAALPRQRTQVILPIDTLKETEVYAPNFRDGERVALVRFPHGGTFEIPDLRVNNNHPEASKLLKGSTDAIGINSKVAERLSGADFDGDTVLVIPNNSGRVKITPALSGLKDFDARTTYRAYEGMPRMTTREKQTQMGLVSNLITDMSLRNASTGELARAVRHSMVVIDAEKHNLNWKQSALDNGIAQLNEKYQGTKRGGSSTLISRAGSPVRVPERKPRTAKKGGPVDPVTGKKVYEETGRTYVNKNGERVPSVTKSKRLAETDDANTLNSDGGIGTRMERIYAEHSNKLKGMANEARREALNTKPRLYSSSAKKVYSNEVQSLNSQLELAVRNRPLERQAQVIANAAVKAKRQANPNMEPDTLKKVKFQELETARTRTGAKKTKIAITPKEWEAIQAGAISTSKLNAILDNADLDVVKALATPRSAVLMTPTKQRRAEQMLGDGYTRAEVADALGVSITTLDRSSES